VVDAEGLVGYVEEGWEVVCELRNGRVVVKGAGVVVWFEALYDEHGLKFFRRLAEEGLEIRMRLSFT